MNALRERLATFGPAAMSDSELLTLVLGDRVEGDTLGRSVLDQVGSPRGLLTRRLAELSSIPGMTTARAQRLLAAVELGLRAQTVTDFGRPLMSADDVAARWQRLGSEANELFVAIAVNARNKVTGEWVIARGWESGVNLTPRQIFTLLAKESVGRVLFLHNHPSGDPTPSPEDVRFTRRLLEAARTLDMKILDHVVVAATGHASLRETTRGELEFG